MRIAFSTDGGVAYFPRRQAAATLDLEALPLDQRNRLCRLIESARFWTRAPDDATAAHPDARTYVIAIEDGSRQCSRRIAEPVADPDMRALVLAIRDCIARR
ncbi:MAG: protealysin inhibitor emfourin [Casimicrobiaceae bacterium]